MNFAHGTNHHLKGNDLINPALPPKLHKSLTNLKTITTSTTPAAATAAASASTSPSPSSTAAASAAPANTCNQRKTHQNTENATTAGSNINNSNTTSTNCNNFSTLSSSSLAASSVALANTTSVQTIYTLSKPHHAPISPSSNASATTTIGSTSSHHTAAASSYFQPTRKIDHDHIIKITQQPPSLTLPLSTTSTISSFTSSTSKINSSTFYPLQNNVTYTLPKNSGGKMSLNSTINSVVSKVPSVISLPSSSAGHDNLNAANVAGNVNVANENLHYSTGLHHPAVNDAAALISKSTTLPKILRTKREPHNASTLNNTSHLILNATTNNHLLTNNNNNSCSTNSSSGPSALNPTTNYAVSQCSMPAYPKQYNLSSSSSAAANASSSQSKTHAHHTTTTATSQSQPPTNINMQTQTITSTLAANYCPEDSHLNPHHITANNTTTTTTSSSSNSNSNNHSISTNNAKQLPVCTTSKNCLNPKEHFLPNDTSLDDDYLSECENCKIAQSSKYYLDAEALAAGPQETMTLQRKSMEECKDEPETGYYRISHTLPTNSKKNT